MTSCASCGMRQNALEPYGGDKEKEGCWIGRNCPRCAQTDKPTDTRWCAESKDANTRGCRCFWPRSEEKKLAWDHLYHHTPTSHTSSCTREPAPVRCGCKPFSIFCHIIARNTHAHTLCLSGRVRGAFTEAKRGQEVSCDEVAWMRVKPITLSSACARAHVELVERARERENTEKRNGYATTPTHILQAKR